MSNKMKRVREVLLLKNYFDEKSINLLKSATRLQEVVITVEKSFLIYDIDFVYSPIKDKFIRLSNKEEETNHMIMYKVCGDSCITPCFKTEIPVEDFITLITKLVFRPKAIRLS